MLGRACTPSVALTWIMTLCLAAKTTLPNVAPCGMIRMSALSNNFACMNKHSKLSAHEGERHRLAKQEDHSDHYLVGKCKALHVCKLERPTLMLTLMISIVDLEVVARLSHGQGHCVPLHARRCSAAC